MYHKRFLSNKCEKLTSSRKRAERWEKLTPIASILMYSQRFDKETGKTALELIHLSLISEAKNLLKTADQGVAETAYDLGFENTSYFARLFKKQTGMKPLEFRKSIHLN